MPTGKTHNCEVSQFPPKGDDLKGQQQTNKRMAKYADAVIIVTDEPDSLDKNLIEHAEKRDMPVHVHRIGSSPKHDGQRTRLVR